MMVHALSRPCRAEYNGWSSEEPGDSMLLELVHSYDWPGVLARVASHPSEVKLAGLDGRCPLHIACEHDAPAVVIQSLLKAGPEVSTFVGSSNMTPLHVTCSSSHASVHVIRVLLEQGVPEQCSMRDVDGDTPLHTASRCGANMEVLEVLLMAYPDAVNQRDHEGLTPLLRLWVRYFVILGDDVINNVRGAADLTGELGEAWMKTELLLAYAHYGAVSPEKESSTRLILHAASAIDCPRAVVKIASVVYPHQLDEKDEQGHTPLMLAAQAPVFKVRDLTDDGFDLEDVIYGINEITNNNEFFDAGNIESSPSSSSSSQPSVIEILLRAGMESGCFTALIPDKRGRYPLHMALVAGKKWNEGVREMVEAYPESLAIQHPSKLYPFMLASEDKPDNADTIYELLRGNPSLMWDLVSKPDRR